MIYLLFLYRGGRRRNRSFGTRGLFFFFFLFFIVGLLVSLLVFRNLALSFDFLRLRRRCLLKQQSINSQTQSA
jgi:hypothetical protein